MLQVSLLRSLPQTNRDLKGRSSQKTPEIVEESKKFGQMYFDGPRSYGYGGYHYDGRWIPVAKDIVAYYSLQPGMRVLDIGCAKGFLVKDLLQVCPGLEVYGIDVSSYALLHAESEVVGRLHKGDARSLPFPNHSFDVVLAINSLHNLNRDDLIEALREINRVGKGKAFVQVDAYLSEAQKELFKKWVLTAETYGYPEEWIKIFEEAQYRGDYDWTILEE